MVKAITEPADKEDVPGKSISVALVTLVNVLAKGAKAEPAEYVP